MPITLREFELRQTPVRTRMPFRYGIATLTEVPYLFVVGEFNVDGQRSCGMSADVLPPKWFTKRAEGQLDDEIDEMKQVIRTACRHAMDVGEKASVFGWWREVYDRQMADKTVDNCPPLLKGFGASLLERAAMDAFCRRHQTPFHEAVRCNTFGIDLGVMHSELAGAQPADLLPPHPAAHVKLRHTVGLTDPLTADDVAPVDRLNDSLPQSLDECIQCYRLTHFKIKLPSDVKDAQARLKAVASLVEQHCPEFAFTLDGNEFFLDAGRFREYWHELCADQQIERFLAKGLLVVEQPLHRDIALSEELRQLLTSWPDRPQLIIDESDGELGSLARALDLGYDGTSHKNCKGVTKGIANACLVNHLNARQASRELVITGEDLMNVGPVALLQDLAVVATLGLTHVERNGHHYVAGLSPFPCSVQRAMQDRHKDLYYMHMSAVDNPWPSLRIHQGSVDLGSVNQAPFGYAIDLPVEELERVN